MIILLQARLSAAFAASTTSAAAAPSLPAMTAAAYPNAGNIAVMFRNMASRGYTQRTATLSRPSLLQGKADSSALAATEEGRSEVIGQLAESKDIGLSVEERASLRAERRKQRESARQARINNLGRVKSVRRAGSPTENKGLEALLPPRGSPGSGAPALSGLPDLSKTFTVLGIETSCDDTAAAVVRSDGVVLGEAIAGQEEVHEEWGGVVPGLARDAHAFKMDGVVEKALREAGMDSAADVDAVAVTVGPGLEICLRVGCEKAKKLAAEHQRPFVAVHHLEAHALLSRKPFNEGYVTDAAGTTTSEPLEFPFLGLLVSGGHCQLLLCEGVGLYTVLGGTVDDALGEAYDKAARLLGLKVGGGGGPAVEALASRGNPMAYPLSVPMQARKDCDFSFAGLKNSFRMAVLRAVDDHHRDQQLLRGSEGGDIKGGTGDGSAVTSEESRGAALPEETKANLAACFQNTAIRHLEERVKRAMDSCERGGAPQQSSPGFVSGGGGMHQESTPESRGATGEIIEAGNRGAVKSIAVVGGVAANKEIRRRLQALCDAREPQWRMVVPPARLCTDNGVMVAWAGVERLRNGMSNAPEGQEVYARLPLGSFRSQ